MSLRKLQYPFLTVPVDRFGQTPLDDAQRFEKPACSTLLQKAAQTYEEVR